MSTRFEHVLPALGRLSESDEPIGLGQVGADMNLSPTRAQRVFSDLVGESPKQYQLRVRVQRAAALLIGTNVRIVDIALLVGFENHETFTRAFRRHFSATPSSYRSTNQVWVDQELVGRAMRTAPCIGIYRQRLDHKPRETNTMTSHEITRETLAETPILFGRRKLKKEELADGLAEVLPLAFGHAMNNGLEMIGPPFVRYVEQSAAFFTIEAGVPLGAPAAAPGPDSDLDVGSLPGGEAASTIHQGPYETLGEAHAALDVWMNENDVVPTGAPWEVYVTDPADVPDPADWVTHLYQPI